MQKTTNHKSSVLTFKRWSRKSYAVFRSIGKQIRIGVLTISCSLISVCTFAQTKTDTLTVKSPEREIELDEVVVSASRATTISSQLARTVEVVSKTEIERLVHRDIPSILETTKSVDIRTRGPLGIQSDVGIRGGTFDQTAILLNGINIGDPQTGHHSLNLPVDASAIERVEVLLGSGARVFGPNAFNGAINIITKIPEVNSFTASVGAGQFGLFSANASGGFRSGNLGHFLSASTSSSDGYIENTDFNSKNLYYRLNANLPSIMLDLQAGYNTKAFGANSFYTPRFPEQFEETSTFFSSLKLASKQQPFLSGTVYWRRHTDRFELFRNEAPPWYAGHNYHLTNVFGLNLNWKRASAKESTNVGLELRHENVLSNILGFLLETPRPVPGEAGAFFTKSHHRNGASLFVEQNIYLGRLSISGGTLLYLNSDLDGRVGFFPGIDVGYQLTNNLRWYASANRTLRLPTFTDLFYEGPTNKGNPNLVPEEATSLESGFKASIGNFRFDLAGFLRKGKNMIDWVRSTEEEIWRSVNHTKVDISGFEAGAYFSPKKVSGRVNYEFSLTYSYTTASKLSDQLISNYVLDHLRHKIDLKGYVGLTRWAKIDATVSYLHRNGNFLLYEGGSFVGFRSFEPYVMANVNLQVMPNEQITFSLGASNLLNSNYVSIANVRQPGRWLLARLSFELP